ncbi:MAG: hypothetical protein OEZ16_07225 [Chromatiales bacterium]|nr:hypothetical protein [Chromatiales bacterium]
MSHFIALIGLTLLCAGWIILQQWLRRVDPDRGEYQPGCGACSSGGCNSRNSDSGCSSNKREEVATVNLTDSGSGGSSGENNK